MRRRWLVIAVVGVIVVAGGLALWLVRRGGPDSRIAAAMALAPEHAVRFSWTDWSAVRHELGFSSAQAEDGLQRFLGKAFDADLSSTSALVTSAPTLQRRFGLSPADLSWELYAQGTDGAVLLTALPKEYDVDALRDRLDGLGYQPPAEDDGVWSAGDIGLQRIGGSLTPELTNVTIDTDSEDAADGGPVLAWSDSATFLGKWRDHRRGGPDEDDGVDQVVDAVGEPTSASVYDGDYACSALAMSQADQADQTAAARLVEEAGKVNPMDGFAIADEPDGDVRVAMAFENADQARTNADSRSQLAAGPAPGQGGSFGDRFHLGRVAADGPVVTMELHPLPGTYVLSDLSTGPVLFATC